ncbi:MAG TPA: hypothetical protein IAA80_00950 [Candidatus Gallacutalibacter pullistercoris]|nr:hypothetical protein [Candidatus Gallacutalibacter pullistercoris]
MLQPVDIQPVFYSVCLFPYDSADHFRGPLTQLRRDLFETGKQARVSGKDITSGQVTRYKGSIDKKHIKWVRKNGRIILEEAFPVAGGSTLLCRNQEGQLIARILYQENEWCRSSYFRPGDERAMVILEPDLGQHAIIRYDLIPENGKYRQSLLVACRISPGTACQSAVNAEAGEPTVVACTSLGDFCYCSEEERDLRLALAQDLEKRSELNSISFFCAPSFPLQKSTGVHKNSIFADKVSDDSGNRKVPKNYIPAGQSTRYRVAIKRSGEQVRTDHERLTKPSSNTEESGEDGLSYNQAPAKQIKTSQENCFYFGRLSKNERTGMGRTEQSNGSTAYEGYYQHDRRNGWGVCYYRSGEPCYVGSWKENQRDGWGATFRDTDHALHVGSWHNGIPDPVSSLFDKDGNLRFAGRLENGQKEGFGISYRKEDGSLLVGKWKNDQLTGEGSEFDPEGNLLYVGMWKDGKRDGRGTEFDSQGNVLFVGEWRDNQYYDGIHYSRCLPEEDAVEEFKKI